MKLTLFCFKCRHLVYIYCKATLAPLVAKACNWIMIDVRSMLYAGWSEIWIQVKGASIREKEHVRKIKGFVLFNLNLLLCQIQLASISWWFRFPRINHKFSEESEWLMPFGCFISSRRILSWHVLHYFKAYQN